MLYLYDHGLKSKLESFYPRVIYAPVDKFYQEYLDNNDNEKNSQTILPAISFWRVGHEFNPYNARSNMNTPAMQLRGRVPGKRDLPESEIRQVFSMQIPLEYQIDIWAPTDIVRDDLFTELMYALTLYPYISINYQGKDILYSLMLENAEDLTDISEFDNEGDLYRMSIPVRVPDARLYFYKDVKELKHITIDLNTIDTHNGIIVEDVGKSNKYRGSVWR